MVDSHVNRLRARAVARHRFTSDAPCGLCSHWLVLAKRKKTDNPRVVLKRKKENGQPKGGMGGRHAATTQGF